MAKEFTGYQPETPAETPEEISEEIPAETPAEIPEEISEEIPAETPGDENSLLKKLKAETGIGENEIDKIIKNPEIFRAFKILLLAFGLGLGVAQGTAQEMAPIEKQDEQKDKFFEAKKNFIDLIMRLQNKGLLEYRSREKGFEESVIGQIDKYEIQNSFLYYNPGQEKGKVSGAKNEISQIIYKDKNGTIYDITNYKGEFRAFAVNYEKPVEGFEKKDKDFLNQFNIVIIGNKAKDGIYYREMTAEEVNQILGDVEEKAMQKQAEK